MKSGEEVDAGTICDRRLQERVKGKQKEGGLIIWAFSACDMHSIRDQWLQLLRLQEWPRDKFRLSE